MRNPSSTDTLIQAFRAEQRKHSRRSVNIRVRVFWQGDSAELVQAPGLVQDISVNGFGIELAHYLPEGQAALGRDDGRSAARDRSPHSSTFRRIHGGHGSLVGLRRKRSPTLVAESGGRD